MAQTHRTSWVDISNVITNWILAVGVSIALFTYWGSERTARVEETFKLIDDLNPFRSPRLAAEQAQQFKAMLKYFPERYKEYPLKTTLDLKEAEALFAVRLNPESSDKYEKYDTARKHLNRLIPLAVAYIHGLGDPKILADRECSSLARSYRYFEKLIERFGKDDAYGPLQAWQIIPRAVRKMESEYPRLCSEAHRAYVPPSARHAPIVRIVHQ